MENKFYQEIKSWDWDGIKADAENNPQPDGEDGNTVKCTFLGTVFALVPSGKYYTCFANSNVEEDEAEKDEAWFEALDMIAAEHDMYIFNGEGDPCDLFAAIS